MRPLVARGWRPSSATRAATAIWKVWVRSEHPAHPGEILCGAACVDAHEGGVGIRRDERLHQAVEPREAGMGEGPFGALDELFVALVALVDRIEEGDRIGGVDEDRAAVGRGHLPDRRQLPIVGGEELSPVVPYMESQVLPDLQALAPAAMERSSESASRGPEAWCPGLGPVDVAEGHEPAGVRPVVAIQVLLELRSPAAIDVDDRPQVAAIHHVEEGPHVWNRRRPRPPDPVGEPTPEVIVGVDGGEAGSADRMGPQAYAGDRAEAAEGQVGVPVFVGEETPPDDSWGALPGPRVVLESCVPNSGMGRRNRLHCRHVGRCVASRERRPGSPYGCASGSKPVGAHAGRTRPGNGDSEELAASHPRCAAAPRIRRPER